MNGRGLYYHSYRIHIDSLSAGEVRLLSDLSILSLCFLNLTRAAESRPTTRSFGGVRATPSLRNCSFYASKRAIGMKLLLGYIFFVPWSISFAAQCLYTFFQTYKTLCKMLVLLGKLMHQKEIL